MSLTEVGVCKDEVKSCLARTHSLWYLILRETVAINCGHLRTKAGVPVLRWWAGSLGASNVSDASGLAELGDTSDARERESILC